MNREISLKWFLIVLGVLVVIEVVVLFLLAKSDDLPGYSSEYFPEAICNVDASLCYAYDLDSEGNTIIVWRGSCRTE